MTGRILVGIIGLAALLGGCAQPKGSNLVQQRHDAQIMKRDTLTLLHQREPEIYESARIAPGIGVFESFGVTLGAVGGANGYGIVTDASGREHHMRFGGLKLGIGLGGKVYRIVLVFNDPDALASFVQGGWTAGGEAELAAKKANDGGSRRAAAEFTPVAVYHITDTGLVAEAVLEGARFYRNGDLNID